MWEAQATSRGQLPMQQLPQNPTTSQLVVLTKTFPQQGFVTSQPQQSQVAHLPQLSGLGDYQIVMMNSNKVNPSDINLQTRSHQYDKPLTFSASETKTKASTKPLMTQNVLLQIPQPKV